MISYQKSKTSLITIEGYLEHITYFNEETRYTVARLKPSHLAAGIIVVGYLAGVSPGETLRVKGSWQTHPKYGPQFQIKTYEVKLPAAAEVCGPIWHPALLRGSAPRWPQDWWRSSGRKLWK